MARMPATNPAPAAAPVVAKSKHAVVFVPAIGAWTHRRTETVAMCLNQALDHGSKTPKKFVQRAAPHTLTYGNDQRARVRSIAIEHDDKLESVIDLYEFDYSRVFPAKFERMNLLLKSVYVALTVLMGLGRWFTALGRKAVTPIDKVHMFLAMLLLSGLAIYTGTLLWALFELSTKQIPNWPNDSVTRIQAFVLVLTGIGLVTPAAKKNFERASIDYVSSINYLTMGTDRGELAGQLTSLIDRLTERDQYERIDLFAYSFGSIIAIDTLFPPGREAPSALKPIHSFVTIGCPYDLVRAFWPHYFGKRGALPSSPREWINVWSPADVLSSNFRNDGRTDLNASVGVGVVSEEEANNGPPENMTYEEGLLAEELGFLSALAMLGFRSHRMYWSESEQGWNTGCFSQIVDRIWHREDFLK